MSEPTCRKPYTRPLIRELGRMDLVRQKSFIKGDKGKDWTAGDHTKKF